MKSRVLFISPCRLVPVDLHGQPLYKVRQGVNLAAMTLLGSLQRNDIHAQFIDCAAEGINELRLLNPHLGVVGISNQRLIEMIQGLEPTILLITSMFTAEQILVDEMIKSIKLAFPKLTIIIGGIHASIKPEWHIKEDGPDYILIGEGEESLIELLQAIEQNTINISNITGLVYRDSVGKTIRTCPPMRLECIDRPWAFETVLRKSDGSDRYFDYFTRKSHVYKSCDNDRVASSFAFYGSRGCPFHCAYCATTPRDGSRIRHMGAARMFQDFFRARREFNVVAFYNQADTFGIHPEDRQFISMIANYRRETGDTGFVFNNPNAFFMNCFFMKSKKKVLDELFIESLVLAGFNVVTIALETFSQRFNKKIDFDNIELEDVIALCRMLKQKGLRVDIYLIYGFPDQEEWEFLRDIKNANVLRSIVDSISWHAFTLLPGTTYYESAISTGRIKETKYRELVRQGYGFFRFDDCVNYSKISAEKMLCHIAEYEPAWFEPVKTVSSDPYKFV